jgi:putative PLP-dependent aminotransferase (TIGR04422 family)
MVKKYDAGDVWLKRKFPTFNLKRSDPKVIENILEKMFKGGYPVIFSSGRNAMYFASKNYWTKKNISVFPYSSQCVVVALQKAGLSVETRTDYTSDVVFDQWGILDESCNKKIFIEDSCDSFLPVNSEVLQLNAEFEIWSLPKILGNRFGGILWCKNKKIANEIRNIRNDELKFLCYIKKLLRFLKGISKINYNLWENFEFKSIGLTNFEYGSLLKDVLRWEILYHERSTAYHKNSNFLSMYVNSEVWDIENIEKNGRIPTVLFLNDDTVNEMSEKNNQIVNLHRVEFGSKPRMVAIYRYLKVN